MTAESLPIAVRRVFTPGEPSNQLARFGIGGLVGLITVIAFFELVTGHGPGIDLEIPLRAAQRWVDAGQPYLAGSFDAPPGPDLPFLYPPVVLPFLALLLAVPRELLLIGWIAVCAGAGAWALARLRVPIPIWPFALMWPPFAEAILGGNIQIVLFAVFCALFWRRDPGAPSMHPTAADPADPLRSDEPSGALGTVRTGVLAALIAGFKVSQVHAWAYLMFHRRPAALAGLAVGLALLALTLPITGIGLWGDWLAQVRRATDADWPLAGIAIARYVPLPVALAFTVATIVALAWIPRDRPGLWVGVLGVLGAPSLHTFGILFLVPAMLAIRREIALVAALLVALYTPSSMWTGIVLVIATFALGQRWGVLMEPERAAGAKLSVSPATGAASSAPSA